MAEKIVLTKEVYKQNEIISNKGLAKGCAATGGVLMIAWILYLTGVFAVAPGTLLAINIAFPTVIFLLESTIIYSKTTFVEKSGFKYFLIIQFLIVTFGLNIIIPKHAILMWAVSIILVAHYFNPKISLFTYIIASILMFVGIYLGMFLGEWDSNLLNANGTFVYGEDFYGVNETIISEEATLQQRIRWLVYLRDAAGDDRFLKAFLYYFMPRWLTFSLISLISFSVNVRAMRLLHIESKLAKDSTKLKSELGVASSIQSSVLPKELSGNDKYNIFGLMEAAREIGGDFYDYFYVDDNNIALVIGDVSGKGIPAALFMMKTETLIKSLTMTLKDNTNQIMERVNKNLCDSNDANMFVTCWLGIFNTETGELRYTNAGHNKILIIQNGDVKYESTKPGIILGAFGEAKYEQKTLKLNIGDKVVLYTDGVTEAHNVNDELYGEDRLLSFTKKHMGLIPRDFIHRLKENIDSFTDGTEQFDDITILAYEYRASKDISESRIFKADLKELDDLFEYSSRVLGILGFGSRDIIKINTALEEIFVNIASYAYDNPGTIEIALSKHLDKVVITIKDNGVPFNPLEKEDPDINLDVVDREIGGLGIFMVKKIMDEISYEYVDNQNVLTMVKYKR